jgi:hypothetical protein
LAIDSQRYQSDQPQMPAQPSLPRAWDELPAANVSRQSANQTPFLSAPTRVPSSPAVLTFPKRPGSLFQ